MRGSGQDGSGTVGRLGSVLTLERTQEDSPDRPSDEPGHNGTRGLQSGGRCYKHTTDGLIRKRTTVPIDVQFGSLCHRAVRPTS